MASSGNSSNIAPGFNPPLVNPPYFGVTSFTPTSTTPMPSDEELVTCLMKARSLMTAQGHDTNHTFYKILWPPNPSIIALGSWATVGSLPTLLKSEPAAEIFRPIGGVLDHTGTSQWSSYVVRPGEHPWAQISSPWIVLLVLCPGVPGRRKLALDKWARILDSNSNNVNGRCRYQGLLFGAEPYTRFHILTMATFATQKGCFAAMKDFLEWGYTTPVLLGTPFQIVPMKKMET